jgi:hypothetical protein
MPTKAIANLIPTIQSASLVGENLRVMKKKKKQSTKDILDLGMTNIVGTSMIKINADIISTL